MDQSNSGCMTFGKFIRHHREAENISLRVLAETLKISPAYLSEIERGTRCAPAIATGLPKRIREELGIVEEANAPLYQRFCDLAGESRGNSYEEINHYLAIQPTLRQLIRLAEEYEIDDNFWLEIINLIK